MQDEMSPLWNAFLRTRIQDVLEELRQDETFNSILLKHVKIELRTTLYRTICSEHVPGESFMQWTTIFGIECLQRQQNDLIFSPEQQLRFLHYLQAITSFIYDVCKAKATLPKQPVVRMQVPRPFAPIFSSVPAKKHRRDLPSSMIVANFPPKKHAALAPIFKNKSNV